MQAGSNGPSIKDAFERNGIAVNVFTFNDAIYHTLINRLSSKVLRVPHYTGTASLNSELIKCAESVKPDLIVLIKPVFVWPETVVQLRQICPVYSWYPDAVTYKKNTSDHFLRAIPLYTAHFCSNYHSVKDFIAAGAKEAYFIPITVDDKCHYRVDLTDAERQQGSDLVFIGTYANESRYHVLNALVKEGLGLRVYGTGWNHMPKDSVLRAPGIVQGRTVFCKDMSAVIQASKINLNFVREHNREVLSCRTFEIPACGGFMLHQWTELVEQYFTEGIEAEYFRSYEECVDKVRFYLAHESSRNSIARAGYEKVQSSPYFIHHAAEKILHMTTS